VRGSPPAATGTARTERRAASARFRPSASARLPVRDAPAADEQRERTWRPLLLGEGSSVSASSRPTAHCSVGRHGAAVVAAGADAAPLLLRRSERLEDASRRARSGRPASALSGRARTTAIAWRKRARVGGRLGLSLVVRRRSKLASDETGASTRKRRRTPARARAAATVSLPGRPPHGPHARAVGKPDLSYHLEAMAEIQALVALTRRLEVRGHRVSIAHLEHRSHQG